MNLNVKKLKDLIRHYLDEAQLSDDEDQIIVLCSILDDVEGFEKELHERLTNHDCDEKVCLFSKIIREILGE